MAAYLSSVFGAGLQAFTNQGIILAGGKLYTYQAGSTTPQGTWISSAQTVTNANPIILDSAGRLPNEIWLQGGSTYKFVLTDSAGNTLGTFDNIAGVNDANYAGFSEWVVYAPVTTYVSSNSFTVAGNKTAIFQVGRRIQFSVAGGTYYATVLTSVFTSLTTVTLTMDSTGLDATLYAVAYGFMSAVNTSLPGSIYAPLISPTFSGNPTVPTQAISDATTKIATDQFVQRAINGSVSVNCAGSADVTLSSAQYSYPIINLTGILTGNIKVILPGQTGLWEVLNNTAGAFTITLTNGGADPGVLIAQGMTKNVVSNASNTYDSRNDFTGITISNAALTNVPTAPTAAPGTNTTQLATTSFVVTSYAPIASPTFTGTPAAPTPTAGDNTTKLATTAFVQATAFSAALPNQTGNSGKFVTTNGTTASWAVIPPATGSTIYLAQTQGAL